MTGGFQPIVFAGSKYNVKIWFENLLLADRSSNSYPDFFLEFDIFLLQMTIACFFIFIVIFSQAAALEEKGKELQKSAFLNGQQADLL